MLTGVRKKEACHLEWKDVALERGEFTVRGKGDTVNRLPLADAAIAILSLERGKHSSRASLTRCSVSKPVARVKAATRRLSLMPLRRPSIEHAPRPG